MSESFEQNTTITKMPNGEYNCSCDMGLWSINAKSKYGAIEDGKKMYFEHLDEGWYDEE